MAAVTTSESLVKAWCCSLVLSLLPLDLGSGPVSALKGGDSVLTSIVVLASCWQIAVVDIGGTKIFFREYLYIFFSSPLSQRMVKCI